MPLRKYYGEFDEDYFRDANDAGIVVCTSGTSGKPKAVYQPPKKIHSNNRAACRVQGITRNSKVYTCLNPIKAGGLFAQTIPALSVGATVDLDKFNPYEYTRVVNKYTHSHLTPYQAKGVIMTKRFKRLNLTGHTFMCGSEPVTWDIIEAFIERGARVICIWGMTEVGVNAIMHIFENMNDVKEWQVKAPPNTTILGNIFNVGFSVEDNDCLMVKGDLSVYDEWFNTEDLVTMQNGALWYKGRLGVPVDFNKPRKG